jgi:hypothetical protein
MTDNNIATTALSIKKKYRLTPLEIQQINDLQHAYGTNNLMSAIRYSRSAQMPDVARMLLQHCGVRTVLAPSIKGIIPDKDSAQKIYPLDKYQVACRLGNATLQVESEIGEATKSLSSVWLTKTGETEISKAVETAIRKAIRKYGVLLARHGVEVLPGKTILTEEKLLSLYGAWLENASAKNWSMLEIITNELGNSDESINWGIPEPMPIRIEKYFHAKANRKMNREEADKLWSLLNEHKVNEIIHAMSCIPACEFSLHKIERLLTPRDLWELYELDTEERIEKLFCRKLMRAPSREEMNAILHFLDETKTSWEDFWEVADGLKPIEFLTLATVKERLFDVFEKQEDERYEDERKSELAEQSYNLTRTPDEDNYDYSVIDNESLESDDYLDDYDLDDQEI